jgi:hypothetical protein
MVALLADAQREGAPVLVQIGKGEAEQSNEAHPGATEHPDHTP